MDPNTGYLTHQLMRTATSPLSSATRDLPLLGKDAPALVEDIVLESGKIIYYMQLDTHKTLADEDLRKRASRRGKRAIRVMERMVEDLENALLQDDDTPCSEEFDADESFADESLVEEDSCELYDSDDDEEEEYELSYKFEDPDNSYIPTSPWLDGSSSSESLASTESSGSLFSSASTDSVSSSQMDEEEEEEEEEEESVGQRIDEFVVSAEARYPMTEDTYVCVEAPTAASADHQEEPEEGLTTSNSDTYASAPPGLAGAVLPAYGVASASSPAQRKTTSTVDNEIATSMNTAVFEDESASGIALAIAPEAVVAAHLPTLSSAPCGVTASAQPSGVINSNMLQVCIPRKNKRRADDDDEYDDDDHHYREEASEAAPDRVSLPKSKKFKATHDVDVSPARESTKVEPAPQLQGTGTGGGPPPSLLTPFLSPLSPTPAPAPAARRPVQKRKREEEEDGELRECDEHTRPAPVPKKLKRTPASVENLNLCGAPVAARPARPLARTRARVPPPYTPHTHTRATRPTKTQTRAKPLAHAARPPPHSFTHEHDSSLNLKRDEQQARRVSADVTVLAMQTKVGRTRVANGGG